MEEARATQRHSYLSKRKAKHAEARRVTSAESSLRRSKAEVNVG